MLQGELERLALHPQLRGAGTGRLLGLAHPDPGGRLLTGHHRQVLPFVQVEALHHRAGVLSALQRIGNTAEQRHQLTGGTHLAFRVAQVKVSELPIKPPSDQRLSLVDERSKCGPSTFYNKISWILSRWHDKDVGRQGRYAISDQLTHRRTEEGKAGPATCLIWTGQLIDPSSCRVTT